MTERQNIMTVGSRNQNCVGVLMNVANTAKDKTRRTRRLKKNSGKSFQAKHESRIRESRFRIRILIGL